jgi:CheY-like chemotaxis protein
MATCLLLHEVLPKDAAVMYYAETRRSTSVQPGDVLATGRILVVDDDRAFGNFMLAALESGGHHVEWASTLADGLSCLHNSRYDLVIVDLKLPDGSGLELLRNADDDGLLRNSAAVLLTGHDFEAPHDIRVFSKATDLERFLAGAGEIVAQAKRKRAARALRGGNGHAGLASDNPRTKRRTRIDLVLYTSPASGKCQKAIRAIQQVLDRYNVSQVNFTICDVAADPEVAEEDSIVFTPTLVKRGPGPRTWLIGNLDQADVLVDLLDGSGVDRRRD